MAKLASSPSFGAALREVSSHVDSLRTRYLDAHIANKLATPDDYDIDVRSYCILCHAAIEEYFEFVALTVFDQLVPPIGRIKKPKLAHSLLIATYSAKLTIPEVAEEIGKTAEDYLIEVCKPLRKSYVKMIDDNHGISLRHLQQMLVRIGIAIPQDAKLLNSLNKLVTYRGSTAHKRLVTTPMDPLDATKVVKDCVELCSVVRNLAIEVIR